MDILITNIAELLQIREQHIEKISGKDMATLPMLKNAWLLLHNDTIADFGTMENCPSIAGAQIIDATGKTVLPAWCDSHTHIVYAGNRVQECVVRFNGLS